MEKHAVTQKNGGEGGATLFKLVFFWCGAKIQKATHTESILQVHQLPAQISEIHCRQNAVCADVTVVLTPGQRADYFHVSPPAALLNILPL